MKERNITIDYIKGFAIISVICAHCNAVLDSANQFAVISSLFLQNIGTLGVICFFVISGMLFHHPGKDMGKFFKKKIKNIVIPWIISATCVYLYVYLRKPQVTLHSWMNFVLGNGSYCYYLTVLMVLYLLFIVFPIMRTNSVLILCEVITIISTIWFYNIWNINPYLNILNWIGYFALGVQITQNLSPWSKLKKIFCSYSLLSVFISGGYILLLGIQLYNRNGGSYWNGLNVIFCWLGAITLVLIAQQLAKKQSCAIPQIIRRAGEDSFAIYIWHMPIAGIVARIMCIGPLNWFVLIRPIIVLVIMLLAFSGAKQLIKKMKKHQVAVYMGIHM